MKRYQDRKKTFVRKNEYIRSAEVRLVDSDGTMLGVRPIREAISLAKERELDLVEIAPQAAPPVCKILDYSKYLYELEKKNRLNRKKQKAGLLKEIRVKSRIASHDFDTKVNHAREFIGKKDKVRFTVIFRGRENKHRDIGRDLLLSIQDKLSDVATAEGRIQTTGNRMSLVLGPKN